MSDNTIGEIPTTPTKHNNTIFLNNTPTKIPPAQKGICSSKDDSQNPKMELDLGDNSNKYPPIYYCKIENPERGSKCEENYYDFHLSGIRNTDEINPRLGELLGELSIARKRIGEPAIEIDIEKLNQELKEKKDETNTYFHLFCVNFKDYLDIVSYFDYLLQKKGYSRSGNSDFKNNKTLNLLLNGTEKENLKRKISNLETESNNGSSNTQQHKKPRNNSLNIPGASQLFGDNNATRKNNKIQPLSGNTQPLSENTEPMKGGRKKLKRNSKSKKKSKPKKKRTRHTKKKLKRSIK